MASFLVVLPELRKSARTRTHREVELHARDQRPHSYAQGEATLSVPVPVSSAHAPWLKKIFLLIN